jgi:hypothetical protein
MAHANLVPYLRHNLDVLYVGLNPPEQSNDNHHYFSGNQSRFFHLLYLSGLIVRPVDKARADEIVFGGNSINFRGAQYGVVDLVRYHVQTDSRRMRPTSKHVDALLADIRHFNPALVCSAPSYLDTVDRIIMPPAPAAWQAQPAPGLETGSHGVRSATPDCSAA